MIQINFESHGIEIDTETNGISSRIWLDLDEAFAVRSWLDANLDDLLRKQKEQKEKERREECNRLRERLAFLETST